MIVYITDVCNTPSDTPYKSSSGAKLLVTAQNSVCVKDALGKVLSCTEEVAVDQVPRQSNPEEAVTSVVWGDRTIHKWGLVRGRSRQDRIKADLELVGFPALHDMLEPMAKSEMDELSSDKERIASLVGSTSTQTPMC